MNDRFANVFAAFSLAALGLSTTGCATPVEHDVAKAATYGAARWSYSGATGPEFWGNLSPDYDLCKSGKQQSPIDLRSSATKTAGSALSFEYQVTPLDLTNNGHTIQHAIVPGSFLGANGKKYQLLQFHFHSKSEHTLDGQQQDLELHLVHQSADGEYAVVGVLFREGDESDFLKAIWDRIPAAAGEKAQDEAILVDVTQALPSDRAHFAYGGSFTTPPGTEGVKWHVFRDVAECSSEQLASYRAVYSGNFRPTQELHGRVVELRE